jgi:hypothetical protein
MISASLMMSGLRGMELSKWRATVQLQDLNELVACPRCSHYAVLASHTLFGMLWAWAMRPQSPKYPVVPFSNLATNKSS